MTASLSSQKRTRTTRTSWVSQWANCPMSIRLSCKMTCWDGVQRSLHRSITKRWWYSSHWGQERTQARSRSMVWQRSRPFSIELIWVSQHNVRTSYRLVAASWRVKWMMRRSLAQTCSQDARALSYLVTWSTWRATSPTCLLKQACTTLNILPSMKLTFSSKTLSQSVKSSPITTEASLC